MALFQGWSPSIDSPASVRRFLAASAMGSVVLLVYASLVPLDYTPLSWDETWLRWKQIVWLDLQLFNRADWVANALVVLPSGMLAAAAFDWGRRGSWALIFVAPVITLCLVGVVAGIEFIQIWFPTRTLSLNDIVAGYIGAVLGPLIWIAFGSHIEHGITRFLTLPRFEDRLRWLCVGYLVFTVVYSMMPLDIVLSRSEWQARLATGNIRLNPFERGLTDPETIKGVMLSAVRMGPIGVLFALLSWRARAAWCLALLPAAFEILQLPLYSKHVTTAELLGGWLGGATGYFLGANLFRLHGLVQRPITWGFAWISALATTLAALLFNFEEVLRDSTEIARRFADAWQWPLVGYYSGSEYNALTNMLVKIGLFAVMGVAAFGWRKTSSNRLSRVIVGTTLVVAIVAAFAIEIVQILLPPHVADISDAVTYLLGYGAGYHVTKLLWGQSPGLPLPRRNKRAPTPRSLVVSGE